MDSSKMPGSLENTDMERTFEATVMEGPEGKRIEEATRAELAKLQKALEAGHQM